MWLFVSVNWLTKLYSGCGWVRALYNILEKKVSSIEFNIYADPSCWNFQVLRNAWTGVQCDETQFPKCENDYWLCSVLTMCKSHKITLKIWKNPFECWFAQHVCFLLKKIFAVIIQLFISMPVRKKKLCRAFLLRYHANLPNTNICLGTLIEMLRF